MTITPTASPQEASRAASAGALLLDVRTPIEYAACHARGARNLPLAELRTRGVQFLGSQPPGTRIYLICKSGARAAEARELLAKHGVRDACVVEGGTDHWTALGLPIEARTIAWTLERQVRLAAGSIVLAFSVLGFAVHPLLHLGAAFAGAGLVFAGLTNWCGMALLLARAPWNTRIAGQPAAPTA